MKTFLSFLLAFFLLESGAASAVPPPDFDEMVRLSQKACDGIKDYTCLFNRRERIGKALVAQRNVRTKVRKPFCVLLSWMEGKMAGAESLYFPSKFGDKIRAHAGGVLQYLTLSLNPDGSLAMKDSRHSIRDFGIEYLVRRISLDVKRSRETGEGSVTFQKEAVLAGGPAWVYEGRFPEGKGFYGSRVVVCFDEKTFLPLKLSMYDKDDTLLEEYEFDDLRLNVGLTDDDFQFRRK
jgi:hypothetical protein